MLDLTMEAVERLYHARPFHFPAAVRGRLEKGERFGGTGLADPARAIREADEEPPDTMGWLLMALHGFRPETTEEQFAELAQAALMATSGAALSYAGIDGFRKLAEEMGLL